MSVTNYFTVIKFFTRGRFTANVSEVVVVPRLELEVNLEDVSAAIEVAVRRLGYDSPTTQKEAVTAFVKGNDVFVFLPTGGGKSLCYSCLPWVFDALRSGGEVGSEHPSIVVVGSPLLSLMKDQVSMLFSVLED